MANKQNAVQIGSALGRVIDKHGGTATWAQITAALGEEFVIKNWLTQVRGPLQGLLDANILVRTNSVHVEAYQKHPRFTQGK